MEFAIFEETVGLIREWIECRKIENEYLLITKYNGEYRQMSKSMIRDRVRKIGKLVGIENLYPHSLRKTSINLLANAGGIDLASEFANHTGVDVTKKHYIKKRYLRRLLIVRNFIIIVRIFVLIRNSAQT